MDWLSISKISFKEFWSINVPYYTYGKILYLVWGFFSSKQLFGVLFKHRENDGFTETSKY